MFTDVLGYSRMTGRDEKNALKPLDGSNLNDRILFEYNGEMVIEESIVADWYGSDILVKDVILPKEFNLERAYPNPFNSITTLQYSLSKDSRVSLIIYDLQGKIAAELVNDIKIAGYYSMEDDLINAGAIYTDKPAVVDDNIISTAHYKDMGPWMKEVIKKI